MVSIIMEVWNKYPLSSEKGVILDLIHYKLMVRLSLVMQKWQKFPGILFFFSPPTWCKAVVTQVSTLCWWLFCLEWCLEDLGVTGVPWCLEDLGVTGKSFLYACVLLCGSHLEYLFGLHILLCPSTSVHLALCSGKHANYMGSINWPLILWFLFGFGWWYISRGME